MPCVVLDDRHDRHAATVERGRPRRAGLCRRLARLSPRLGRRWPAVADTWWGAPTSAPQPRTARAASREPPGPHPPVPRWPSPGSSARWRPSASAVVAVNVAGAEGHRAGRSRRCRRPSVEAGARRGRHRAVRLGPRGEGPVDDSTRRRRRPRLGRRVRERRRSGDDRSGGRARSRAARARRGRRAPRSRPAPVARTTADPPRGQRIVG